MPDLVLAELQASMLAVCAAPGGVSAGTAIVAAVQPSTGLSPEDRLGIYARGYLARLLEGLRDDFPVLRAFVGDQVFDLFAQGFAWAHPPASPSLFDFGAGFADYLEATRPRPSTGDTGIDAIPAAIARLERARVEAARAQGVETDPDHLPVDLVRLLRTADVFVRVPDSLRLLHLKFALADGEDPVAGDTWYAVARAHYRVRTHMVEPWQHEFLEGCGTDGLALRRASLTDDDWARLLTWLPLAAEAGIATVLIRT